jgi:Ion channel
MRKHRLDCGQTNALGGTMAQTHRIATLYPLIVGTGVTLITIVIHALAVITIVNFVRRERRLGHAGARFAGDLMIVSSVILIALAAHLVEISIWAWVLKMCGEFSEAETAFYESAMNYTTLGYGDVVMSPRWKLLGPFEAADGMLMFGVSTAMIFAVMQRLVTTRFKDLE